MFILFKDISLNRILYNKSYLHPRSTKVIECGTVRMYHQTELDESLFPRVVFLCCQSQKKVVDFNLSSSIGHNELREVSCCNTNGAFFNVI